MNHDESVWEANIRCGMSWLYSMGQSLLNGLLFQHTLVDGVDSSILTLSSAKSGCFHQPPASSCSSRPWGWPTQVKQFNICSTWSPHLTGTTRDNSALPFQSNELYCCAPVLRIFRSRAHCLCHPFCTKPHEITRAAHSVRVFMPWPGETCDILAVSANLQSIAVKASNLRNAQVLNTSYNQTHSALRRESIICCRRTALIFKWYKTKTTAKGKRIKIIDTSGRFQYHRPVGISFGNRWSQGHGDYS